MVLANPSASLALALAAGTWSLSALLVVLGAAATAASPGGSVLTRAACSDADTPEDCAKLLCQCAPDTFAATFSAGRDAAAVLEEGALERATSYGFVGCGAHTGYATPAQSASPAMRTGAADQHTVGGYGERWCYTLGGDACNDASLEYAVGMSLAHPVEERKPTLGPRTRWKRCRGHLGCSARITGPMAQEATGAILHEVRNLFSCAPLDQWGGRRGGYRRLIGGSL